MTITFHLFKITQRKNRNNKNRKLNIKKNLYKNKDKN